MNTPSGWSSRTRARGAFLAAGAVALAVLFSLVIAATAMPRLVLPPCD